jgi:probable rRNA maturation factor
MTVNVFVRARSGARVTRLRLPLKKAVISALGAKKAGGELNLVLVGDAEIKRLNKTFLSHTGVTDVLAFSHPRPVFPHGRETPPFGDIYICLPQARRQAAKLGHSLETELLILTVHGTLHLAGMDDSSPSRRRAMNEKTVRILKKLI